MMDIHGTISKNKTLKANFSKTLEIDGKIVHPANDVYKGSYIVTPSEDVQILHTEGLVMNDDVTIDKIPDNYGLITWNGTILTVS